MQIFGRSVNTFKSQKHRGKQQGDGDNDVKVPGSFQPGDEADIRIKWQEKVFGPQEVIDVSMVHQRHGRKSAKRGHNITRLEASRFPECRTTGEAIHEDSRNHLHRKVKFSVYLQLMVFARIPKAVNCGALQIGTCAPACHPLHNHNQNAGK